ncbi:MAG: (Fe-S)-binding protein [Planctomycetota bacterium]|nr:(Fe-S)-binding protein [Planctomycetota bacterium]MDA1114059.1 (Fe-S)-binding protein [Planctomycetota bacterium]
MKLDPQTTPDGFPRPEGNTHLPCDSSDGLPGLFDCMHCGLCLQSCPTYLATGLETDSPRGRLTLLRAEMEGRIEAPAIGNALDRCVQCHACEVVCPSDVPYNSLLQGFQERHPDLKTTQRLSYWLGSTRRLRAISGLARFMQRKSIQALAQKVAPKKLQRMLQAIPQTPTAFHPTSGASYPAIGKQRGRVSLHLGCVDSNFFGNVLQQTVELLNQEGFAVSIPAQPSCCGALEAHSGAGAVGRLRGTDTLQALSGFDAILVTAAGCQAFLHQLDPREKVLDPLEFLLEHGIRSELKPVVQQFALDTPCHKQNILGTPDAALEILRNIPGLEILPHPYADECCGAGGIAFLREPEMTDAVGKRKAAALLSVKPQVVVSANSGCRIQIEASLRKQGSDLKIVHPISLLHQSIFKK